MLYLWIPKPTMISMFSERNVSQLRNLISILPSVKKLIMTSLAHRRPIQLPNFVKQSTKPLDLSNVTPKKLSSRLPYAKFMFDNGIKWRALFHTGACANVMSRGKLHEKGEIDKLEVKLKRPVCISFKIAWVQLVGIEKHTEIKFEIAQREFLKTFLRFFQLILSMSAFPSLSSMTFLLSPNKALVHSWTWQSNIIKTSHEKRNDEPTDKRKI